MEEKLTEKITAIDLEKKEELTEQAGIALGLSYINLLGFPISAKVLSSISEEEASAYRVIPFFRTDTHLRVAVVDPEEKKTKAFVDELRKRYPHHELSVYITSQHSFDAAAKLFKTIAKFRPIQRDLVISKEHLDRFSSQITSFKQLDSALKQVNLSEKFLMIIASALNENSSDIHIETEEKEVTVRFRIDGVLQRVATLEKDLWPKLISRVKAVAGLKININTIPQDGRITVDLGTERLDIRVSTLPTSYGESVVMRLLSSRSTGLTFEDVGLRGKAFEDLKREIQRPNGMIVTTGPTGSGKTTTMYAILNKLNTPDVKIITLEDPIEYKLPGVTQSQVDFSHKYTFARGLRSILRQDPDILMVGEIRDLETADIAIQASLTGHLVLSTIHTNDASGAIPRFLSMGVKPFLLAPAINAIIGQRLVRKLCQKCKHEAQLDADMLEHVRGLLEDIPQTAEVKVNMNALKFYQAAGCGECNNGYKGRTAIFEIFSMNEEIEKVILSGKVAEYDMKDLAHQYGMITMVQDGLLKAMDGITSVSEVFRVAE